MEEDKTSSSGRKVKDVPRRTLFAASVIDIGTNLLKIGDSLVIGIKKFQSGMRNTTCERGKKRKNNDED